MTHSKKYQYRIPSRKKDPLLVILDASSLIRMASLINPQDLHPDDPRNPTLLEFIDHLGKLGAKIVIPESVIFECIGHRGNGKRLTRQFMNDIEYPYLRDFFEDVAKGRVPNTSIARSPIGDYHLAELEERKNDFEEFNRYKRAKLIGFGDQDIVTYVEESEHKGDMFVLTEDSPLTERLVDARTKKGGP